MDWTKIAPWNWFKEDERHAAPSALDHVDLARDSAALMERLFQDRLERSYGALRRVLSLPDDADEEAIEAKFRNGGLKLRIPKHAVRAPRGRSIEIAGI